ncbi:MULTISPECIES: hypothetical protein [Vibrio]|uniref:hypothetical protein n=1 Tax=Vibrio TaxID=662 RepID=UPI000543BC47|nr:MULTISPECIES: hypothetical protein [Vibrio]EGR1569452.1 hypothetical protein [Vibrio parahaemolyticus]EIE7521251.1 hypothetical protein [Vibrio parahaemolyticus]EJC7971268.1 hypothetical protein [Vibrio parahaemolyticus]EJG1621167.1 hypothetical protein [Vibrio parahaemolyticus]ELA9412622.1 hypothetical protein [Vibrio parahaemolyticus]
MSNTQEKVEDDNVVDLSSGDSNEHQPQVRRKNLNYIIKLYTATIIAGALFYTAYLNPEVFTLHETTLSEIKEAYNLIVLLGIPFIFGSIGASARVLISGMQVGQSLKLIFSSGLIATFSWLSVKSKIFLALITPYVAESALKGSKEASEALQTNSSEMYSLALVAVLVGMFASNIYIFIEQRVEQLSSKGQKPA